MKYLFLFGLLIALVIDGCKQEESVTPPAPSKPNPCSSDTISTYGSGWMAFRAVNAGDSFYVKGDYKPSAQFLNDTMGAGAGGFVHDTTIGGRKRRGELTAYYHTFRNGLQLSRLMVFTIINDSGSLSTGLYSWSSSSIHSISKTVNVEYQLLSDSLGTYSTFDARSGLLIITALDTCAHRIAGSFSGTVWIPTDTTMQVYITHGEFDIFYTKKYFIY